MIDSQDVQTNEVETAEPSRLTTLKREATELGLTYSPNISEKKLQERIDAHYESLAGPVVQAKAETGTVGEVGVKIDTMAAYAAKAEAEANKTRVVQIIDNDRRVNNHTTTCTVSCSNEYFDLGQVILPLNTAVEVRQGHINVLKSVEIPQHVTVPGSNLSRLEIRPRYSIQYVDQEA